MTLEDFLDIQKRMKNIGDKHAALAEQAKSGREAHKSFSIASQAYSMVLKLQSEIFNSPAGSPNLYMSMVSNKVLRSELWRGYLDFCLSQGISSIPKGEFFSRLKEMGCKFSITNGETFVTPPRNGVKALPFLDVKGIAFGEDLA